MLIDLVELPWHEPAKGSRFKTLQQAGKRVRLVEYTEDFVEAEWCHHGHVGYVVKGELEIDLHGTIMSLREGDGIFILRARQNRHRHHATIKPATLFLVEDVEE